MRDLLRHELRMRLGAIFSWGAGLALFAALYVRIYPEIAKQMSQGGSHFSIYKAVDIDMGSFEGFVASTVVQFIPLMLGVYALVNGTDTLAGEEDRGTLELIVAMPLSRWRLVTAKAVAMAVAALVILAFAGAGGAVMLSKMQLETAVGATAIFLAILTAWPITMAFMMISLFLGAYLPTRRSAAVVATAIFIGSYFGERLTSLVDALEPFQRLSLFHYFDSSAELFSGGVKAGDVLVQLGVTLIFFGLSLLSFERRNITVGALPWQRGRTAEVPKSAKGSGLGKPGAL